MAEIGNHYRYFPVDDDAMRWGAYVTGAGTANILPQATYPPFGHPTLYHFDWRRGRTLPEFQMVLVTEGSGEFESAPTGRVTFSGPTLIRLFPGVWHRYRPVEDVGWTERWLSFNGDLFHRLWNQGLIEPTRAVAWIDERSSLVEQFDAVLHHLFDPLFAHAAIYSLQALRLIAASLESLKSLPPPATATVSGATDRTVDPIVDGVLAIVQTQSHRSISIDEVAQSLAVPRRTLDRRFAAARGRSILEEIDLHRFHRAKRLLAHTDISIRVIADMIGFSSADRLAVVFSRHENVSPAEYRRQRPRSGSSSGIARSE